MSDQSTVDMFSAAESAAIFSEDRAYRYLLRRRWHRGDEMLFCMLNPSAADEWGNDPTVERCRRRALRMGFGALAVVNLFALVSTDPAALARHHDPIGPRNDATIIGSAKRAEIVVCGWGSHAMATTRGAAVLALIRGAGKRPYALAINIDGAPSHPLYKPYDAMPRLMA